MPTDNLPDQKGLALLRVIVGRIRSGEIRKGEPKTFLEPFQALTLLGVAGSGLALKHNGLASLERWTSQHEALPKVGALIVYKNGHTPLKSFMKSNGQKYNPEGLAWWRKEADRAIDFDWTPWAGIVRYKRGAKDMSDLRGREDKRSGQIDVATTLARLRTAGVTVSEVLRWLSKGISEADILQQHQQLHRDDIRASLAYAAEKEERLDEVQAKLARLDRFTEQWGDKFTLAKFDSDDPRMDYLLKRYWNERQ